MPAKKLKYTDAPKNRELAIGRVLPDRTPRAAEYLDNVRDFNQTQTWDIKKTMKLCKKLYYFGGSISTAIDILTEFPITKFSVENIKSPRCKKSIDYFVQNVNKDNPNALPGLYRVARQAAHDYFLYGNAFVYEVWSMVNDADFGINGKNMPMKLNIMNPISMHVPKEYVTMGQRRIFLEVDPNIVKVLKKRGRKSESDKEMIAGLPKQITDAAKKPGWNGKVEIDNEFITQLRRKGQSYDAWGIPYLTKAFSAAATLQRLRLLDDSTIEGLVNYITIFRIGDPDNPATWSQERLSAFSNMMRDPAASNYIVWPYDIDVITTGPDGKILDMDDKYKQVNYEILGALGIPEILFSGQGSQAGVWTAVLAMLERLEKFRDDLQLFLEMLLRKVCIQNGYTKEFPKIRWARMSLRDDDAVKNVVLSMYDRGLIPKQAVISEFGYDYEYFRSRRQEEKENGDDEIFAIPNMPFSTPGGNDEEDDKKDDKDENKDEKKSDPTSEDGRPPITTKKDSTAELSIEVVRELAHSRIDKAKEMLVEAATNKKQFLGDVEAGSIIGTAYLLVNRDIDNGISTIVTVAKHLADDADFSCDGRDLRIRLTDRIHHERNDCITQTVALARRLSLQEIDVDEFEEELAIILDASKTGIDGSIGELESFEANTTEQVSRILRG